MSLKKIKKFLNYKSYLDKIHRSNDDLYALQTILKLFPENTYLPFTPFSLNPYTIIHILNDILFNKREYIVEFGTGISTVILSRFIRINNLKTQVLTIDNNKEWQDLIYQQIEKYGSIDQIKMLHADIKTQHYTGFCDYDNTMWYDHTIISNALEDIDMIDLVIVDGPSTSSSPYARYPAIPVLKEKLAKNFTIFLDDTRRPAEKEIAMKWSDLLDAAIHFEKMYATITIGQSLSTRPLSH